MENNNFKDFTNLYEIPKTLRFELKMAGWIINEDLFLWEKNFKWKTWTEYYLAKNEVFWKDQIINESYKKIKYFLDKLHIQFIEESLKNLKLEDLSKIEEKFLEWQKENDKDKKAKIKEKIFGDKNWKWWLFSELREKISKEFVENGKSWKEIHNAKQYKDEKWKIVEIKWKWYEILFSEKNLYILSGVFKEEDLWDKVIVEDIEWKKQNLFKSFKGFTTYFWNFNENRKNFYKDDWKTGRISTRIIDENLVFFLKNKKSFDEKYKNKDIFINKFNEILEKNFWEKVENIFKLDFYNNCFTWKQIEYYNQLIWELNSIINLQKQADYSKYTQEKKENKNIEFKKSDYPLFKELYKQILSERTTEQKFIEIGDFSDVKKYLKELSEKNSKKNILVKNLIENIVNNYKNDYDLSKIYLSKISINTISAKFFWSEKWSFIQEKLLEKIWKKNENWKKDLPDFINLEIIQKALEEAQEESEEDIFKNDFNDINAENSFEKLLKIFQKELSENLDKNKEYLKRIEENIMKISDFSNKEKESQVEIIKNYLDSSLSIYRMMKYFALEKWKKSLEWEYDTDEKFYNEFKKFYIDNEIISYYNEFRNFLTKKPYNQDKIKLNFENWTLLDGWDKNKEPDNFGTLLRKDWKYFLALQIYWQKNIFYKKKWSFVKDIKEAYETKNGEVLFEKVDYKLLQDPEKMIPKCSTQLNYVKKHFSKSNTDIILPEPKKTNFTSQLTITKEIFDLNNYEYEKNYLKNCWEDFDFTKRVIADSKKKSQIKIFQKEFYSLTWNSEVYKKGLNAWINFCQRFLKSYSSATEFDLHFYEADKYESLEKFYDYVTKNTYSINFRKVSEKYIYKNIEKGNIYLFEIYNKDFSAWNTWKQNLHTMYFKGLFEENNLKNKDIVLKLNWQAEIFRRKASIEPKIDKCRKAKRSITGYKRYTEDKLFFHCPITLNFVKYNRDVNHKILEYLNENKKINIIWIDRWEKHLAYYSVIDQKWNILKDENWKLIKWSFNIIDIFWKNNEKVWEKNYYEKLVEKEEERKEARWSWKTIGNIKELKEWYISQVVHKLAELIIKYNAIIVFEDLNSGFKRWRQKIERQVYQKLEKALIEKLNYLTFKDKNFWEAWHYLSAYQLTQPFETFEKIGKQTWIIFYTDPSYTSQTCPSCWFRKDLYLKYSNLENARWDVEKIDSIIFEKWRFVFEYNKRKVFSDRDRKRNISSIESWVKWWETVDNNITENLVNLFKKSKINFQNWENIILQIQEANEKELYKELFKNFNAILNIRNSTIWDNSRNWDFICCPSCDFDSRIDNQIWIENWDDNGAFNIARKWIIILEKINKAFEKKKEASKIKWPDMIVKQEDWDKYLEENKFKP